ncbi:hypothetical protein BASA50_001269 [Batrachochytrium salamandrivorans]|uniref:Uncharacterized protein n=1 Tax=Batrachochytrium salamandrivorans TaxID=1357716 RepID=A0ABQ8EVR4_9FUNG|nr:hypothetical protein BASA50_001269 [Batrachochytrium salamandrivorans]
MRLISFAMVSLLAITVSALPPYNPDTQNTSPSPDDAIQNMDQSPSISAEDIEGLMEFDTEMLDQLLNDAVQNAQQPQGAATHSAQQSPGATSQDLDQSLGYILRDIREFQGISAQEIDEVLGATSQDLEQYLDAATQDIHEFQGISAQEVDEVLDATTQSAQQSPDAAIQDIREFQGISAQEVDEVLGATSQDLEQYLDAAIQDIHEFQGISAQEDIQKSQYTATQMLESFLDAAQSAQQSDQDKVLVEMNRLTEALKIQDDRCFQMDLQINTEKQKNTEVKTIKDRIAMKLRRAGISSDKRLEMKRTAHNLKMMANKLTIGNSEQYQSYEDVMTKRRDANAELQLLKENQKLIAEHNSKNVAQVGLSPNSCYNMGILLSQYDKALKDIDTSLVEQQTIDNAISVFDNDALKAKSKQLENEIQDLRSYSKIAKEILRQHGHSQPIYM